jgi:hypothetical protein
MKAACFKALLLHIEASLLCLFSFGRLPKIKLDSLLGLLTRMGECSNDLPRGVESLIERLPENAPFQLGDRIFAIGRCVVAHGASPSPHWRTGPRQKGTKCRPERHRRCHGQNCRSPASCLRRFRFSGARRAVVTYWAEQRAALVEAVTAGVEIVVDQSVRARMQRQIARLAALARDFQVRHAFARVPKILRPQLA